MRLSQPQNVETAQAWVQALTLPALADRLRLLAQEPRSFSVAQRRALIERAAACVEAWDDGSDPFSAKR